ncbi:uncharacterized protein LOC123550124 [Mercenaria mercenaria]|uniref:uncharacterized protein LOC123550124 n=1 Tax=Mercenaria mercenaria TaxID=6596 RepID=UPI00234E9BDA|nr:uncharacterized protein LOC123550124 [Mercenaria mercenaria]
MEKSSDGLQTSIGNVPTTSAADAHRPETDTTHPDGLLPSLQTGPVTPATPSTSAKDMHIPGSYSSCHECTADDLTRGVKRKYGEYKNETTTYTRQKSCNYTHTSKPRGVKREFAYDKSEQPRKRFKAAPPEVKIAQPETKNEPSVSNSSTGDGSKNVPNNDSSDIYSADSRDVLDAQPVAASSKDVSEEESRYAQGEQSDDEILCPRFCVCNVGHSSIPEPIERSLPIAVPLYWCLLIRRLYSLSNMKYTCCQSRCVRRYQRESAMRVSLRHMTEDYYAPDLRVNRYSWGEWKE